MDPLTGERYQMTNMWFGESGSATQMQKVMHAVLGIGEPGKQMIKPPQEKLTLNF